VQSCPELAGLTQQGAKAALLEKALLEGEDESAYDAGR